MIASNIKYNQSKQPVKGRLSIKQMYSIAYSGQHELVRAKFIELLREEREFYNNKEILSQVIWGSLQRINHLKEVLNYTAVNNEIEFLKEVMNQFLSFSQDKKSYPRELFQSIIYVSEELITQSRLEEATEYLNKAMVLGIGKFPSLRVDATNKLSEIYNKKGELTDSSNELYKLADHPYLFTDRNQAPETFYRLSKNSLKSGRINEYKQFLLLGLKYFYTNISERKKIFSQLQLTYKNSFLLLFNSELNLISKIIYLIHWFHFRLPNFGRIKFGFINSLSRKALLGTIYFYNYFRKSSDQSFRKDRICNNYPFLFERNNQIELDPKSYKKGKDILITRAMGGIGDLLMMTPGIHALKKKYGNKKIHLAIPRRYFSLFWGNEDVALLDIESDFFSHYDYSRWFNFTDCPAARGESRRAPKVRKGRIELFAKALGIRNIRFKFMSKKPRYYISDEEIEFANIFWKEFKLKDEKVIGIQLKSDESYRNYPLMEDLVKTISQKYRILLFDGEKIDGFDFEKVLKIDSFCLRKAFALAHKCDVIIAPDSSFVHLAATFDIPTIAIYGPIDGRVRTKLYSNCTYIDSRKSLGCLPCWRNENIACKLTGMRSSACLQGIPIENVIKELENKLAMIDNDTT